MSERIATAHHNLVCDLCGQVIPRGSKFRLIRDDFMPGIAYMEHIRCPNAKAVLTTNTQPKRPVLKNQNAMTLA